MPATLPTPRFTRWESEVTLGGLQLDEDVVLRVARCLAGGRWYVSLQTLRRATPPQESWTLRSQTIIPMERAASLAAILQRSGKES